MALVKCQTVVNILEELAPKRLAESWDNVGLLVGDGRQEVRRIMVCLDVPEWVVDEAIEKKVDMIIAHHPIIFSGIKKVNNDTVLGRKLLKLIKNNIQVYCCHTNYDIAAGGLNDILTEHFGFSKHEVIEITNQEKLYKLVVYVPINHEEKVFDAMLRAGAGHIGNYSACSFRIAGKGTFKPEAGSSPFIGSVNKLEEVDEYRVETIATEKVLGKVIREMLKAHPYEEAAYDIYELVNKGQAQGVGRLVTLDKEISLANLAENVKKALSIDTVKLAGSKDRKVGKLAILNGTGNKFINAAYFAGAQVLITGDMQHHETLDALELGMSVIDAGHYATEKLMIKAVSEYLNNKLRDLKYDVDITESATNLEPMEYI
ncbi:MAG: Nif3-like dinuclear metal center hexameric protein [Bacillota bacterium]